MTEFLRMVIILPLLVFMMYFLPTMLLQFATKKPKKRK